MKRTPSRVSPIVVAYSATMLLAPPLVAQTTTMPSTLRYGSGLIDVPVSSTLPHLHLTGTLSGFWLSLGARDQIDPTGATTSVGPPVDEFYSDASLAIGLGERTELGMSLQAFGDDASGGDVWGLFGRVRLWEPVDQGLGLAVGGRYLTSPSFGDARSYSPGRLGFPDDRLRDAYQGGTRGVGTNLSLYGVATAFLRGFDGGPIPDNDMTFTLGYGGGMFASGGELDFYAPGHANGWFFGSAIHVEASERTLVTLMAEHNGFDINVGAQVDWDGLRFGAHYLATNHVYPAAGVTSEYQKPKLGFLASVAICPNVPGLRCRPSKMRRVEPDTIRLPAPPPDTVVVRVGGQGDVSGTDASLCLSTGQAIPIRLTATGDTLVGPNWISVRAMRPNVVFAGGYAGGAFWYESGQDLDFEDALFEKSVDTFPVDCSQVLRVGVHEGVPIFAVVSARRPLDVLFIPIRPGVWHRYTRVRAPD